MSERNGCSSSKHSLIETAPNHSLMEALNHHSFVEVVKSAVLDRDCLVAVALSEGNSYMAAAAAMMPEMNSWMLQVM